MTPPTAEPLKPMTDEEGRIAEALELKRRLDADDMQATMQLYKSWQKRALQAEATITALQAQLAEAQRALVKEESAHERSLKERDLAQDCLQQTHINLGGDGEWVAKAGSVDQPPDTGDLHYDVPALAAETLERVEYAEKQLAEATGWRPHTEAPEEVRSLAGQIEPKLGQSCCKAAMAHTGKRFAFIFDNPYTEKYVWLKLPPQAGKEWRDAGRN